MRNQKEINVAKFESIRWEQKDGSFHGKAHISRKPFGLFEVNFQINSKNGMTGVAVRNYDFPCLNWAKSCINYEYVVESVKQRFDEIDELVRNIPQEVQKAAQEVAKNEYLRLISTAVGIAAIGKEQMKEAGE